ncbi:hypothetical protein [Natrarchaeobaculum sulfurireducens]|uniref:Secreted glycoprotein n=1 Tax=Natrarchaeobaculum sulfurireducens TaxID=2044521 RepID=A0A346PDK9_9EURY|nr:hypothetical protein [Natrarchaeobaculum sulfurireducens]AXR77604.1 hypothetical protein AArc1_1265 [Natrarchaeobaculum sulfurireducens]
MMRWGDERAVTVQIGAVLLLAILFTALALYQVNAVPAENEVVEIEHNEDVQADLQQVRNAIVSVPGGNSGESRSVSLGTSYPTRTFAMNPGPMSGSLESEQLGDIEIKNAEPVDDSDQIVDDWEEGYPTYGLTYTPGYNEYQDAPQTRYEHGLLYNHHPNDERLNVGGQSQLVVDGDEITIVTLQGNYSESGQGTVSVDVREFSTSTNTVGVESDDDDPMEITLPTNSPDNWSDTFSETTDYNITTNDDSVTVEFNNTERTYDLRMAEVGVGDATRESPEERVEYIAELSGTDSTVLEFRDRFNNPVSNAEIRSIEDIEGLTEEIVNVDNLPESTGSDGRVSLEEADSVPTSSQKYTWIEETDSDGEATVELDVDSNALEQDDVVVSTTVMSEEDSEATFAEIIDVDLEGDNPEISVRAWKLFSDTVEGPIIGLPIGEEVEFDVASNTNVHIVATVDSDEEDLDNGENGGSEPPPNGDSDTELPDGAVAFNDESGAGQYEEGEETYTESDLESFDDDSADLRIKRDITSGSEGFDISAQTVHIGSDTDISTDGTNAEIQVQAENGIEMGSSTVSTEGTNAEIQMQTEGNIAMSSSTVSTEGTNAEIQIQAGGTISMQSAEVTTQGNNAEISISAAGAIDQAGATVLAENAGETIE